MRLQSLELTDFGPYRSTQTFPFARQPGVELVWGENGRGKTTLLNALRYALFGLVLGRHSTVIDLTTVGNIDSGSGGGGCGFKTVLAFAHDGTDYVLTRAFSPLDPTRPAVTRGDFRETLLLRKDGSVLGPDEGRRELTRLFPEQIARFFLFDAELLQEYEQLLTPGSAVGERLKEAIERILGVPVLTQARADVAALLRTARTAQAAAARSDRSTRDLGNSLQLAQDEAAAAQENVADLAEQVEELMTSVNDLETQLSAMQRYRDRLARRNAKRDEVQRLKTVARERLEDLHDLIPELWQAVLAPAAARLLDQIDGELEDMERRRDAAVLAAGTIQRLHEASRAGRCPTCQQDVAPAHLEHLRAESEQVEDSAPLGERIVDLRTRRRALRDLAGRPDLIAERERAAEQARVELSDAEQDLQDLQQAVHDAPEQEHEVVTLVGRHASTSTSLENTRGRLAAAREDLQTKEQAVATISGRLARVRGTSSAAEDRKVELLVRLQEVLDAAVTDFRDRLRDRIEEEATEVFRVLSAEPGYDRLRINNNYGLTILYDDGRPVVNRSSGYEHVVAVSLIAALQRCSPANGPIITDSPFGRLDRTNKRHVLQALPQLTDQVVLLVHDDELNRETAIELLGPDLVAEHHLNRVTVRHTLIAPGAPA